jgi:hypothetical protein
MNLTIPQTTPRAVQVFPSGMQIPANVLRFHLRFAQPPAAVADVNACVRLRDGAGQVIEHAFLDLPHGLWSADTLDLPRFHGQFRGS